MTFLRKTTQYLKNFYAKYPDFCCLMFLLVGVALAYWPVTFYVGHLKWDKPDTTLPWFSLLSDIYQSGQFPWWNPYQGLGYPIYGDLQNPIWNPLFVLFLHIVNFDYGWFHFMEIMIMWLASVGMYYLLRFFGVSRRGAFLFGLSYALSGFIVGRGQNLISNLGAAWMPFALHHLLAFFKKPGFKTAIFMAFFLGLQITGGYQALSIILAYLCVVLLVYYLIHWLINREYPILRLLLYGGMAAVILLMLCGLTFYVVLDTFPYISRASGLSEEWVLAGFFPINSLENFLIPSYTMGIDSNEFFGSDRSFRNLYFGFFGVVFFVTALFHWKKIPMVLKVLFFFGIVCFVAAMGDYTPFRLWLARYLPGLDLFRFPFFFAWFFVLPLIIMAAIAFDRYTQKPFRPKQLFNILLVCFGILVFVIMLNHYFKSGWPGMFTGWSWRSWDEHLKALNRNELGVLHGAVQVAIIGITGGALFFLRWNKKRVLSVMIVLEVFIAMQFLQPFTYTDAAFDPKDTWREHEKLTDSFPIPELIPLTDLDSLSVQYTPLWRNIGNFFRYPDRDGYSSYWLKNISDVQNNYPKFHDSVSERAVVYWADSVTAVDTFQGGNMVYSKHVYSDVRKDIPRQSSGKIKLKKFGPGGIAMDVTTAHKNLLVVQQNQFHRWRAEIDGVEQKTQTVNGFMLGVVVPQGEHEIIFDFEEGWVIEFYYFNIVVWFLTFLFLVYTEIKKWRLNRQNSTH